jgi:hypothetical protein
VYSGRATGLQALRESYTTTPNKGDSWAPTFDHSSEEEEESNLTESFL